MRFTHSPYWHSYIRYTHNMLKCVPTDSQTKSVCVYSESYLKNSRRLVRTILTNQFILVNQNDYFEAAREHAILFREVGCLPLIIFVMLT